MEFSGVKFDLLPATTQVPPSRSTNKAKDPKVWLAGELIIRCEHQGISSLPPQLLYKSTVRNLILTDNQLEALPVELFTQLTQLRQLHVGHNRLSHLPEQVCLLQQLEQLDLQHNQLQLVPASLIRCIHLEVVNLDGNPLCSWLRQLWPKPAAANADADAGAGANAGAGDSAASKGGRARGAALRTLKAKTQALLKHLLEEQDAETQQQVKQAQLSVLQEACKAQLNQQLRIVDPESLANTYRAAAAAQLGQGALAQVQEMQAAAEALQAATAAVQQQRQQQGAQHEAVPADLQEQLAARLQRVKELCKPRRPAGALYINAHDLLRELQRQQLQRGWRCAADAPAETQPSLAAATPGPTAAAAAAGPVAIRRAGAAGAADAGSAAADQGSAGGGRRFMTSAERTRQQLVQGGAKSYQEWLEVKQAQEQRERQQIKERARSEAQARLQAAADRASQAVANCEKEQQWPSRRAEAYPHGTFSLSPQVLKAVRKAYHKSPPLE